MDYGLWTDDSQLQAPNSKLPTPSSQLQTPNSKLPTQNPQLKPTSFPVYP